jgi:hypothetical protein
MLIVPGMGFADRSIDETVLGADPEQLQARLSRDLHVGEGIAATRAPYAAYNLRHGAHNEALDASKTIRVASEHLSCAYGFALRTSSGPRDAPGLLFVVHQPPPDAFTRGHARRGRLPRAHDVHLDACKLLLGV